MIPIHIIVAVDAANGIGKEGTLPWHLPADLRHFKDITCATMAKEKKNAVIMGRKTWESLPEKFRPLPQRLNIVLSRNPDWSAPPAVLRADSLEAALDLLNKPPLREAIETAFIIGGGEIFQTALERRLVTKIYLTQIFQDYRCDTFLPPLEHFRMVTSSDRYEESGITYLFREYVSEAEPQSS